MTTIYVPEGTPVAVQLRIEDEVGGVVEEHEHACAFVDCSDEIRGAQKLAQVNDILWPSEDTARIAVDTLLDLAGSMIRRARLD